MEGRQAQDMSCQHSLSDTTFGFPIQFPIFILLSSFDDEDNHNSNSASGSLPDGTYNQDTLYQYCGYTTSVGQLAPCQF